MEDPPLVDAAAPAPDAAVAALRAALGLRAGARRALLRQLRAVPGRGPARGRGGPRARGRSSCSWAASRRRSPRCAARAAAAGARCVFAGKRPLGGAARVPGPGRRPGLAAPARASNTPFKVYTYLASGKPLVATRIATHTQLLDDSLAVPRRADRGRPRRRHPPGPRRPRRSGRRAPRARRAADRARVQPGPLRGEGAPRLRGDRGGSARPDGHVVRRRRRRRPR